MTALNVMITQLKTIFCLTDDEEKRMRQREIVLAENRTLKAVHGFNNKYAREWVDPFVGVVYCNYLYQVGHMAYKKGWNSIADKVYALNKMLHGVDLFYVVELPEIWSCEHPVGTVMGRAVYGNRFFFYQGCTVGGSRHDGKLYYPVIGDDVLMYSNSKILGRCTIGNHVIFAANSYVIDQDIPENSIVFGQKPNLVIKTMGE